MQNIKGLKGRHVINHSDCFWSLLCESKKHINKLNKNQIQNKRGVYIFFDWNDVPIRIGKALNVRNRLLSYANNPVNYDLFNKMKDDIQFVGIIYTIDENDSMFVELDLLNQYNPIYNYRKG